MFTYSCPKCRRQLSCENLPSGAVRECTNCHQKMRVVADDKSANGSEPRRGSGCGLLLVCVCGLAGMFMGGAILLGGYIYESKAAQSAGIKDLFAQANEQANAKVDAGAKAEAEAKTNAASRPNKNSKADGNTKAESEPKSNHELKTDDDPKANVRPQSDNGPMASDDLYNEMLRSVVWILASDGKDSWSGSGSLIDRDERLVITNQHVANRRCTKIWVFFPIFHDGKLVTESESYLADLKRDKPEHAITAKFVYDQAICDLALIRLSRLPAGVKAIRLTKRKIKPGQMLHTVGGKPRGNTGVWIYSSGAVRQISTKQWTYGDGIKREGEVIASSVSTNPGDSGGAVVDSRGYLVGVHAMSTDGVLNAGHIHVNEVRRFLQTAYRVQLEKQFTEPHEEEGATISADRVAELMRKLEASESDKRKQAIIGLGKIGPDAQKATIALLQLVRNKTEVDAVRRAAVAALTEIGPPDYEYLKKLLAALDDKNCVDARRYAALSLASFPEDKRKEVFEALKKALKDDDAKVRQNAAIALGSYGKAGQDEAYAELVECLRDTEPGVRKSAHETLKAGGVPDEVDLPVVRELLEGEKDGKKPTREARYWGVLLLVRKFKEKGLPYIVEALEKEENFEDLEFVYFILNTLREFKFNSLEVGAILSKALDHREESVWDVAIDTFMALNGRTFGDLVKPEENTVEALIKICVKYPKLATKLEDTNNGKKGEKDRFKNNLKEICTTFNTKKDTLGFTSSPRLVEILSKALSESDDLARRVAINCLERIGKDKEAAKAAPALKVALLREKSADIRIEILAALAALGKAGGAVLGDDKELQEELDKWIGDARADNHTAQVMAALAMAALYPDQKQTSKAYRVLARALLLTNAPLQIDVVQLTRFGAKAMAVERAKPDPHEVELHERAKQALGVGGVMAGEAVYTVFDSTFWPTPTEKVNMVCDKIYARITAFQVFAKIGPQLKDLKKYVRGRNSILVWLLIDKELKLEKLNLEYSRVVDAAREAKVEIFGNK